MLLTIYWSWMSKTDEMPWRYAAPKRNEIKLSYSLQQVAIMPHIFLTLITGVRKVLKLYLIWYLRVVMHG